LGFVTSLNRPDNNITGVISLALRLAAKRVEFLHELVRTPTKLALLENPTAPGTLSQIERRDIESAARALRWQFQVVHAGTAAEFDAPFATLVRERVEALIIATDIFFYSEMSRLAELSAQHRLPAVGSLRDFPAAGGLMSYSTSIPNTPASTPPAFSKASHHAILLNRTRPTPGRLKKLGPKANSQRSSAGSAPAVPHRFAADLQMIEISSANSRERRASFLSSSPLGQPDSRSFGPRSRRRDGARLKAMLS
jgi:hypothetical protein